MSSYPSPMCYSCAKFKGFPKSIGSSGKCSQYRSIPKGIFYEGGSCNYYEPRTVKNTVRKKK